MTCQAGSPIIWSYRSRNSSVGGPVKRHAVRVLDQHHLVAVPVAEQTGQAADVVDRRLERRESNPVVLDAKQVGQAVAEAGRLRSFEHIATSDNRRRRARGHTRT